jgi:CheY-like chemotaxis protein
MEWPQCSSVPIFAMSSNAFVEDRQRCLDAGINDLVAKPIDVAALYSLRWAPRP